MDLNKKLAYDISRIMEVCIVSDDLASNFDYLLDRCQQVILEQCLRMTKGNQSNAAKLLKVSRNTIRRWIIKYKLNVLDYKCLNLAEAKKRLMDQL